MRKLNVLIVLLALLLVFGFAFVGCDNGTTSGVNITIVPGSSLAEKLAWIDKNAESEGNYLIELDADESIDPVTLRYGDRTYITITLKGVDENRTISLSSNGGLFTVGSGVTLVLEDNITLQGHSGNNAPLVYIPSGGKLVMNTGSTITGNTNTTGSNAGVNVWGNFTMNGGTISNHTGFSGVFVSSNGIITMNGGTISDNIGRGVHMWGAFIMNDGTISGNTAGEYGGGVTWSANSTFTMSGGTITGNTAKYGGGVDTNGTFTKTGGTITGSDSENGNIATQSNSGNAIFAGIWNGSSFNNLKLKETTSDPADNLSYDGSTGAFTGSWDN
jgi:hypothetical protein